MHAFLPLPALFSTLLAFLLLDVVLASHNVDHTLKRHHLSRADDAADQRGVAVRGEFSLAKRFDQAKFSYYAAGMGACGKTNSASDYIVALNSAQFAGGAHCFEMITITINGKSTQAQIVDQCPGCPFGGLDCSEGLFTFFEPTAAGIIFGSWVFGAGTSPPPPSPSPSLPSPPKPEPTTTTPTPTPTPSPTSTTQSETSTSTTATSTIASSSSSAPASSSSVAPDTHASVAPGNLEGFNLFILQVASAMLGNA
ncbi:RlpA-like double-psi beta-barrel-protein domain-containing protein-containing protein [Infundibulicybe gibba]|nr:RlpA-like double-psi beta-barrel-protein domain-containing protein-containing protein [Infundibulicybe gibba]